MYFFFIYFYPLLLNRTSEHSEDFRLAKGIITCVHGFAKVNIMFPSVWPIVYTVFNAEVFSLLDSDWLQLLQVHTLFTLTVEVQSYSHLSISVSP